jgi:predicted GIY-YIG superfamily endonuclease
VRYREHHDSKGAALQREAAIKSLDRAAKVALISAGLFGILEEMT